MRETSRTPGASAPRQARNAPQTDAANAVIQFSPEVTQRFADLEAAVHHSDYFDGDVRKNLQEWASGKKASVGLALGDMALIVRETAKYVHETGDTKADAALVNLIDDLIGRNPDSPPVAMLSTNRVPGR